MPIDSSTAPAFPRTHHQSESGHNGISVRTYIATAALQGILANHRLTPFDAPQCHRDDAIVAVRAADALNTPQPTP